MATPQPGIFALGATDHEFLELDLLPGADAAELVRGVVGVAGPLTTGGGVNYVVGFRPSLWRALHPGETPVDAEDWTDELVGHEGYSMPATQRDAWVWIAAADRSRLFDVVHDLRTATSGVARIVTDEIGWHYKESRDLSGFVDGTENPGLLEAPAVVTVPDGEPGAGASVLLYQQWRHEDAWAELDERAQELAMGRTKADDVEMDDDEKPESAHVARTVVEVDGEEQEIFRRNVAYGSATDHGTLFVGFSRDRARMHEMLRRMAGVDGIRDTLTHFMTPLTGAYYVVPSADALAGYVEAAAD